MNLRPGHRTAESIEINLTPLIDVVFLLLIFFMVTTTFDRNAKLKVQLPESSAKVERTTGDPLVLSIDAKGKYYINDQQVINVQLETLKLALLKTIGDRDRQNITIILRADGNTPHQSVVRAMDAAAQLNLTKLSIATVESK
jgi:biopolymer transport protein ExbD